MANDSEEQQVNGPTQRELQVAFLLCDEPAEPTQEKHGGFHECVKAAKPFFSKDLQRLKAISLTL
jgi:hypothetical protein